MGLQQFLGMPTILLAFGYSSPESAAPTFALKLFDVDHDRGTLTVREGKGRKQRVVPIGNRALV